MIHSCMMFDVVNQTMIDHYYILALTKTFLSINKSNSNNRNNRNNRNNSNNNNKNKSNIYIANWKFKYIVTILPADDVYVP